MPNSVLGLPLHPLVVHAVVVLLPLAALGAVALAGWPRWRAPYGWLLLGVTTIATASVPVATSTGEALRDGLGAGGPVAAAIERHQAWGEKVIWAALPLWTLVLAGVLLRRRPGTAATAVWVLAAAAGVAAVVLVVGTGHRGAQAVWNPTG